MKKRILALGLLLPLVAVAQDKPAGEEVADDPHASVLAALELPATAQALRDDGVPADQVADALSASEESGLGADEATEALGTAHAAAKAHGNVDNFGTFVRGKLGEGLRGKDLAAAIRAEHEARGKGKGPGAPGEQGKPTDKAPSEDKGAPADAGEGKGKPAEPRGGADIERPASGSTTKPSSAGGSTAADDKKPSGMGRPGGKGN